MPGGRCRRHPQAADLADGYLLVEHRAAEANLTTFDRAASRLPGARRLPTASP